MVKTIKFNDLKSQLSLHESDIKTAVIGVLESGWYVLGKQVEMFEKTLASYLGVSYVIGVANGLEALQISLLALGIGEGDEVITTPLSAVATTLSILAVGAEPVFVDVNNNGQINHELIKKSITPKTKAILPVHLYGQPSQINIIRELCSKHKLFLIEDAAQAIGTKYKNQFLGTWGQIGCFSFYPTKNLGAFGDAGAIVTNDENIYQICKQIRDYGQANKYIHVRYGLNSRLDEIQAAVLKTKLKYLDKENKNRTKIAKSYFKSLSQIRELTIVTQPVSQPQNFHLFVIATSKRDKLQEYLKENGIETSIHYPLPIPDQPLFGRKYQSLSLPIARRMASTVLSLPCYPTLKLEDVNHINVIIKRFFDR